MKRILLPLDFTETSENALVYALEMAKVYHAKIVLLHTYELPIVDSQLLPINFIEVYESLEATNSDNFAQALEKMKDIAKANNAEVIPLDHIMMTGELLDCIKEVVHLQDIDFVVMGTTGSSDWLDSFIGTNADDVLAEVSVPVLMIAHDTKFHKIETIGFCTRYRQDEIQALKDVLRIARKLEAKVKCLYVNTPDYAFIAEEIAYWESSFEGEEALEFFIKSSEDVAAAIEQFTESHAIDLLAMVTHKQNFFTRLFTTSTTQKMAQHSKTPILALRE
ncbi:universal stress protein [Flavobacterium sp. 25HG05S-40]|uniref:universal stress protein n=1 Tax=Flavobacterium sp. 25HG05S-40 TaxID=3458682 RepID=UPI004044E101